MTDEHDNGDTAGVDRDVSAAYRRIASEKTPPGVNRAVLAAAREALRPPGSSRYRRAWFRPVAFAATLLLGVALLFEMQGQLDDELAPLESSDIAAPEVLKQEFDASTGHPQALRETAAPAAGKLAAPPRADRASAADSGEAVAPEAAPSQEEMRRLQAPNSINPSDDVPDNDDVAATRSLSPGMFDRRQLRAVPAEACSAAQTADAGTWWECIVALRESGNIAAAEAETERLLQRYPDFSVPE